MSLNPESPFNHFLWPTFDNYAKKIYSGEKTLEIRKNIDPLLRMRKDSALPAMAWMYDPESQKFSGCFHVLFFQKLAVVPPPELLKRLAVFGQACVSHVFLRDYLINADHVWAVKVGEVFCFRNTNHFIPLVDVGITGYPKDIATMSDESANKLEQLSGLRASICPRINTLQRKKASRIPTLRNIK